VRDGTVDAVLCSGSPAWNFHRLRLLSERPVTAGVLLTAGSPGELHVGVAAAVANPTAETIWLWGVESAAGLAAVAETEAAGAAAAKAEARLAEALAAGRANLPLSVPETRGNDQATVHGVAQCLTPPAASACTAVQVYAALRLRGEASPTPLRVELRADQDGRPGDPILATAALSPATFGPEPAYRWGSACFDPAPALEPGRRYWVHLPANDVYVWRMVSGGATADTHAWSSKYDYSKHSWVLRVICEPR
jgi:hypothetical protein